MTQRESNLLGGADFRAIPPESDLFREKKRRNFPNKVKKSSVTILGRLENDALRGRSNRRAKLYSTVILLTLTFRDDSVCIQGLVKTKRVQY